MVIPHWAVTTLAVVGFVILAFLVLCLIIGLGRGIFRVITTRRQSKRKQHNEILDYLKRTNKRLKELEESIEDLRHIIATSIAYTEEETDDSDKDESTGNE